MKGRVYQGRGERDVHVEAGPEDQEVWADGVEGTVRKPFTSRIDQT